jgi:NAD(P)-dependent dehydrogenase (short-subunit alcohol dehydrogenase family)
MRDLSNRVAVVTGGANGVGRGLVEALLNEGAKVVIADIEQSVLDTTLRELDGRGEVWGVRTDVSNEDSVRALADAVFGRYGTCNLLCNNAGVTSGGGGLPWEQEPNDWRWCFSVNVFGVAICSLEFVPRMLATGDEGLIVNTSSADGGFAPVLNASVYAASKAAVSCFTEALAHNFIKEGTNLRACVFYPSGGLLETGLWTAQRNRPDHLARVRPRPPAPMTTIADFKAAMEAAGTPVQTMDVLDLGRFAIEQIKAGHYIVTHDIGRIGDLLDARTAAVRDLALPPTLHPYA